MPYRAQGGACRTLVNKPGGGGFTHSRSGKGEKRGRRGTGLCRSKRWFPEASEEGGKRRLVFPKEEGEEEGFSAFSRALPLGSSGEGKRRPLCGNEKGGKRFHLCTPRRDTAIGQAKKSRLHSGKGREKVRGGGRGCSSVHSQTVGPVG